MLSLRLSEGLGHHFWRLRARKYLKNQNFQKIKHEPPGFGKILEKHQKEGNPKIYAFPDALRRFKAHFWGLQDTKCSKSSAKSRNLAQRPIFREKDTFQEKRASNI